jgi:Tol biopolymer transport system component
VARIGVELCRALAAVHGAGLVHRDVKAQNVMRDASGRIVLGDFGTGLEVDPETPDTSMAGTPVYLAPEIFEGQPATAVSDLYSLGVLLFHLATDSYPVAGRSIPELRHAHRTRPSLAALPSSGLPPALAAVIERALSQEPAIRYQSAAAMEQALTQFSVSIRDARDPAPLTGTRRPRARLWLATAVVSVTVVTGGYLGSRSDARFSLASLLPAFGATSESSLSPTRTRQLRRVPAPTEAMFWGQPSPDGRSHTFTDLDGNLALFDTTSGEIRRLTVGADGDIMATETSAFSADSNEIAFGWQDARKIRQVRIIGVQGAVARVVWEGAEWPVVYGWSADGGTLLCSLETDEGTRRLVTISVATGALSELSPLDVGFTRASFTPDARHVVFDRLQAADSVERDVFIVRTDSPGAVRALVESPSDDFAPVWTTTHDRMLFVSDRTAEPSIWSVSIDDEGHIAQAPTILHRNIGRVRPHGLAGGSLFYTLQVGLVEVFRATLDSSNASVLTGTTPIAAAQVGSKMTSDWSPDGHAIVYVALPHAGAGGDRARRLSIIDIRSNEIRTLNPPLNYYSFPRWSPDGRWILVKGTDLTARTGVFLVDARTGATHAVALVDATTPQTIGPVRWAPDARSVFYTRRGLGLMRLDLQTRVETRVLDLAAEGIVGFTNNPGFALSPRNDAIAYSAFRSSVRGTREAVLRVRPLRGPARDLLTGPITLQAWTPDDHLLFTRNDPATQLATLWAIRADGGEPRILSAGVHGLRDLQVHPDGRQVTYTAGFPGGELWELNNFLTAPPQ